MPLALAAAIPACWRSRMNLRSISATIPSTVTRIGPAAPSTAHNGTLLSGTNASRKLLKTNGLDRSKGCAQKAAANEGLEKLAVRSKPDKLQQPLRLPVDQQQGGFDVAFPIAGPGAGKGMVAVALGQGCIGCQLLHDIGHVMLNSPAVLSCFFPLKITLERGCPLNRPH